MKKILDFIRSHRDARLIREYGMVAILVQEQAQAALGTSNEWPQDRYAATAPLGELALKLAHAPYAGLPIVSEGVAQ